MISTSYVPHFDVPKDGRFSAHSKERAHTTCAIGIEREGGGGARVEEEGGGEPGISRGFFFFFLLLLLLCTCVPLCMGSIVYHVPTTTSTSTSNITAYNSGAVSKINVHRHSSTLPSSKLCHGHNGRRRRYGIITCSHESPVTRNVSPTSGVALD